jgi:geranylgeranyl pyrophosphate synthase
MPGLLLVGDAAGMISPFTGEGIGFALESGKVAAETIHRNLPPGGDGVADFSSYSRQLARRYSGYFEAGRHSARRYLLVWHALENTFHNEKPLFALCREAALFPEGIGDSYAATVLGDVGALAAWEAVPVRTDLLTVGEILVDCVRRDWPFLTNLLPADQTASGVPFRPALFLLLACYLNRPEAPGRLSAAAAVELGYLAAIAHRSVVDEPPATTPNDGSRPANWANMFALMVGDFLMSRAYALSAGVSAAVSSEIAHALALASEGRVREVRASFDLRMSDGEHLSILERKTGILFELPCRLGARLGGGSPAQVEALASYGRHTGIAYQLTDDVLGLEGGASQLGRVAGPDLRDGIYSLPVLRAARNGAAGELQRLLGGRQPSGAAVKEAVELVKAAGTAAEVLDLAREHARRARAALAPFADGAVRRALEALTVYSVARSGSVATSEAGSTPRER